ncbi:DEP domain-containing protein DDB_G0279099 [Anopheles marshallii]|uniref:DEP domain-containing protein DDB_G0279099 n=1 Tax=Anopheles marshallii TaxID=1521116 RepID=UPI00237A6636|nr:DEP domain-containing protein DDB_G0279099 [Anopheles marshallii]
MDKDRLFLPDEVVDMDPNMTNRLHQHTVVLDDGAQASTSYSRVSPPKAIIDSSPLQSAMDKNKESLKVKLLVRRSFDQLVQQGIMPPLKTSPAIYEQRRQLERAKTGDLLKAKIKKRPDRVELEQRHILEQCDSNVDPSLAEKRRMLEKALLVDHLNSKISHRPGPLDLIGKNILHVEEPIERMVKEGLVDYASTLDESNISVATPSMEGEDSLSSEGESLHSVAVALVSQPGTTLLQHQIQLQTLQGPTHAPTQQPPTVITTGKPEFFTLKPTIPIVVSDGTVLATIATPVVTTATAVATITAVTGGNIATVAEVAMEQGNSSSTSTPTSTLRPILPTPSANISGDLSSVRPTLTMTTMPTDIKVLSSSSSGNTGSSFNSGGGKEKLVKKKSKSKSITKAKPIKFHEYKGPPNAHKGSSSSSSVAGHGGTSGPGGSDNNYQLIMQQQYLLEYLEEMCKKPTGVSSPSSREQSQITTDGEEIAGSDHTPIDSPLSVGGGSGGVGAGSSRSKNSTAGVNSSTLPTTPANTVDLAVETLNKLKVSQLKKYCKQYNLAVSGTKSNLIERLKPLIKSIDANAASAGSPVGVTDPELEDSLLAEQQKRIAELQQQLKKSQEELEQFRSLCNNPFVGSGGNTIATEEPMVINAPVTIPPPPPPPPSLGTVLVGSPFSISTGDSCDAPSVGSDAVGAGSNQTIEQTKPEPTVPALEGSFLLEGLTAVNADAVDYGHDMREILPPELRSTLSLDRSPTHRPTLDKVLGQVQPTISGLTMNSEANEDRVGMASVSMDLGMRSLSRTNMGTLVGGSSNVRATGGDMQDLSLSMKSVNFDTVNDGGDTSMQQDTIMLNDFEDIDLVDFHMHSLDSDGPFPMITNHDPDPTSTSEHRQHTTPHDTVGLFCNRTDSDNGGKMLSNGFADQPQTQHMHDDMLHDHHQHTYLNNNDLVSSSDGANVMLHLDLMDHNDHQTSLAAPTDTKPLTFGSLHLAQHPLQHNGDHHHHHHQNTSHLQQQQQQHHSDSNNNTSYDANRSAIGLLRFTVQDQPIASTSTSSSSSSTSSSPSSCFRGLGTSLSSKHANKQNHHLNLHQQQQQQHQQHQPQQQQQHQQQQHHQHHNLLDQLSTPPSTNSENSTVIGDTIDSFQDNAMDFESLLTNDTDSVLTDNNCHRMMLDCAQDKPMLSFLPDPSILDYFSEECNGLDYEIKHLEY